MHELLVIGVTQQGQTSDQTITRLVYRSTHMAMERESKQSNFDSSLDLDNHQPTHTSGDKGLTQIVMVNQHFRLTRCDELHLSRGVIFVIQIGSDWPQMGKSVTFYDQASLKSPRLAPNGANLGLFEISFSTFPNQNLKKFQIFPIWSQSGPIGSQR